MVFWNQNDCIPECIIENGMHFINTPYQAGTLDQTDKETLVINSSAFDCVTYVEYILALSLYHCKKEQSFEGYLKALRYRNGEIDGYGSRIHYTSEWINNGVSNGFFKDITADLGGKPTKKTINYITTHRHKYPKLKSGIDIKKITDTELILSNQVHYRIEKQNVDTMLEKLQSGDIIAIETDILGLDISHVGFVMREGNTVKFLHASESKNKVVVSEISLSSYLQSHRHQTAIRVLRAIN